MQVFHFEYDLAGFTIAFREPFLHFTSYHAAYESFNIQFAGWLGKDSLAVTKHGDRIRDLEKLIQFVTDVDAGDTVSFESPQNLHQLFDFRLCQRAGRLIEDQDLGILSQRLGEFGHLHLSYSK